MHAIFAPSSIRRNARLRRVGDLDHAMRDQTPYLYFLLLAMAVVLGGMTTTPAPAIAADQSHQASRSIHVGKSPERSIFL
jgi:hypothetical protein